MDPLSISLAAITFATALKDLIETAQIIRDSISKYPQNYRNAKRLAEGVHKTLRGMEVIYKDHEQALNQSKPLKEAIEDLQKEMKPAYEEFTRLAPPVSEKKIDRFKLAFYSFWNRKKVEELLSELRDHVNQCSHDFQLLSSVRTEAHIVEIRDIIVQSTPHHSVHRSVALNGQSNYCAPSTLHNGLGIVNNTQLYSFTKSTPMPMTWIADTIPAHDLSKAYLRREVGRVIHSFKSVLVHWFQDPAADLEISPASMSWSLEILPLSSIALHQQAVVLAFRIQSLLQESQIDSRIENVYDAARTLSINLVDLGMCEDGIAVSTLLVDLWRTIAKLYPSRKSFRRLSHALLSLATDFLNAKNPSQARSKSDEAIEILRRVAAEEPIDRLKRQDMVLISENVIRYENFKPRSTRSLQKMLGAGRMLEDALGLTHLLSVMADGVSNAAMSSCDRAVISENQGISDDDWYTYATSLRHIAFAHDQPSESQKFAKLALAVLNHLLTTNPGSERVQAQLLKTLTHLSNTLHDATDPQTIAEKLVYITQSVTILQQQLLIDPQRYILHLAHTLWTQNRALISLGRSAEADNIFQTLLGLKNLAAARPHPTLQIPSETEAEYYVRLAQYHYESERFTDAINAAHNSISQYSALEFSDPSQSQAGHIHALTWLCKSLCAAHQYDAALSEGFRAIQLIDISNMDGPDSDLIESYGNVLCAIMQAVVSSPSTGPTGALALRVAEINARARKFMCSRKFASDITSALFLDKYILLLKRNQMIEDAIEIVQEIHNNRGLLYGDLKDPKEAALCYTTCVKLLQDLLEHKGAIEQALHYSEEAITFMKHLAGGTSNDHILCFLDGSHIDLLCSAGRYPEALELSQLTVSNILKDSDIVDIADTTIAAAAFYWLAQTQRCNRKPHDAIAAVTMALSFRQAGLPKGGLITSNISYLCLLLLSTCLHDVGRVEEALSRLDEAEKAALKLKSVNSMEELEATGHDSYEHLLFRQSMLLFTKEDYSEAARLIQKVEIIEKKKLDGGYTALKNYVITLSYSGVLYCTLGRHEEGLAAVLELVELRRNARISCPDVAHLIDIKLDHITRRGAWKSVQIVKAKLTCTHQDGC